MILFGLISYFGTGGQSITALIPSFFGIVFGILGYIAKNRSHFKHALYTAMVLALIGVIGTSGGLINLFYQIEPQAVSKSIMAALCLVYIIAAINTIIANKTLQQR